MVSLLSTQVANLAAPVEEWTVGGTALTALMDVERRHGLSPRLSLSLSLRFGSLSHSTESMNSPLQGSSSL